MCPIGYNAAFCAGWDSNNDDYGGQDCADQPLANISQGLTGCPADIMTNNQIGGIPELVGKWNFMNQTKDELYKNIHGITGTMLFNNNGYYLMTVPNHNPYGDYTLEAGWGTLGHNILAICYAGGCENSTLTTVSPDYIKFKDNNHNTIQLFRIQPTTTITPSTSRETANKGPAVYTNLSGTWSLTSNGPVNKTLGQITFAPNNEFTGTFDANRQPVQGLYTVLNHTASPFANLTLNYIYHNHAVKIDGSLNVTYHDDMKMFYISIYNPHNIRESDYKVTTGLYLHPGVIIYFTRAQPIQLVNSLVGDWTFYNQTSSSPEVTSAVSHGFTAKQRNMTDIFNIINSDFNPNFDPKFNFPSTYPLVIKTNLDKEKWANYVLSLARLKTGDIKISFPSYFTVTPLGANSSKCVMQIGCGSGQWSITENNDGLKLKYDTGSESNQGPQGLPLQLPPRNGYPTGISTILTFKSVTPNHIIAMDSHRDIIVFKRLEKGLS